VRRQPEILLEFELANRGTVRATIETFKGKRYASIRLWVEPRETPGADLIPTSKGISVPVEYIPELLEAAQALASAAS
jgi:hypothetical protein